MGRGECETWEDVVEDSRTERGEAQGIPTLSIPLPIFLSCEERIESLHDPTIRIFGGNINRRRIPARGEGREVDAPLIFISL